MIRRLLLPLLALCVAGLSIVVHHLAPLPDDALCRRGGCGFEQIYASVDARGATPETLSAMVEEDPSNPHAWASYGEFLAAKGDAHAAEAFAQAASLGPGLAPVLMRVANFSFAHDRSSEGLRLVPQILGQTADYDEILFSYLQRLQVTQAQLLGTTIPAAPRPARSWMAWTLQQSSVDDMVESWRWLHRNRLADLKTANDTVNTLWQRGAYLEAQHAWVDWLADPETGYPDTERLDDPRFERQTGNTPFGWDLAPRPGIEYARHDGLEVRFLGQTNVADAGVRQHAVVSPGRYRLVADFSADHISTDEGVFFQVTDVEQPDRLQVRTAPILGTLARTTMTLDVTIPVGTRVVRVELARHPSLRFDSALSGVLTIHRLSLN